MNQIHHNNIVRLKAIKNGLSALDKEIVFVGGAILSLYCDTPIIDVRSTNDVDVIVEILNYKERAKLEEHLRALGFHHDVASGIICRYRHQGFIVDIMPTDDESIGFKNIWYPIAFETATDVQLDANTTIKIPTATCYLATKFEAFKSRGQYDGYSSHDFEDIVFVLQTRTTIWIEMSDTPEILKKYLKKEFTELLNQTNLLDWLDGNVDYKLDKNAVGKILQHIKEFISE